MRIYEAFNEFYSLYVKEKALNDIQEFNMDLVDEIKQFTRTKANLLNPARNTAIGVKKEQKLNAITDSSRYFELYTLRYYFSEYFRIRLTKIESLVDKQQIINYTDQISFLTKLSPQEREFCRDYIHIVHDGLMKSIKPSDEDKETIESICNSSNDEKYDFVFVRGVESLKNVEIKVDGNMQEVDIEKGDVLLCRLAAVKEHIDNGSLEMF